MRFCGDDNVLSIILLNPKHLATIIQQTTKKIGSAF